MGALFLWKGDDIMESIVVQNILSLGNSSMNGITQNRVLFAISNVNMNARNSVDTNTVSNYLEHIGVILENIDTKVFDIINRLKDRTYIKPETHVLTETKSNKNDSDGEDENRFWGDISNFNAILSSVNGIVELFTTFKEIADSYFGRRNNGEQSTQTIDLDSIPGKIICMCNCNCGGGVSSRQGGNSMTDVLDGVKTTAKATWNLLKTGTTVVGLLKAGTKVAGLLKSGTTTAGIEY